MRVVIVGGVAGGMSAAARSSSASRSCDRDGLQLTLGEVQSVDGGLDPTGKAFDAVAQPVLLRQLLTLINQCSAAAR